MPEGRPSEEAIFYAAREIKDKAERSAYLDRACAGDPSLRARVEALIESADAEDEFLEAPVRAARDTLHVGTVSEKPGDVIGRYKLLQKIGEGGFGVVYMAEQKEPIRRRVALKIIKLGMDTKEVVARFEAERQALAMMDHLNIARVFDAGATETGRPYFVMELVHGIPITAYCDKNNLNTQQRLELFTQVCSAIQHAHQKGIIHRDLKPSNVMVTLHDGTPVPKVIDFGIARAMDRPLTDRTLFTAYGQFVGTPQYMSPEQAEMSGLDVDTRSDVYSLGVLLYELLTGTTPFEAEALRSVAYTEVCRIICEVEPPTPSTRISTLGERATEIAKHRHTEPAALGKLIRGDLDWIVMRALEKDRTRRYETATGLAEDIQRHWNDEPVIAGPPSTVYRLRKFIRRNRVKVTAGLLVAAALVLGLSLAAVGLVQAIHQRDRALAASRAELEEKRKRLSAEQRAEEKENEADEARLQAEAERKAKEAEAAAKLQEHRWALLAEGCSLMEHGSYASALERLQKAAAIRHDDAAQLCLWLLARQYWNQAEATWTGHEDTVTAVAFSLDGKTLASTSWDKTITIWDVATGQEIRELDGHAGEVLCVAFSPDGTVLASGSMDETARLWNLDTGQEAGALACNQGRVTCVAFSPDGRTLVSGGESGTMKVWDVAARQESAVLTGHESVVWGVAFSPDGTFLVSGGRDGNVRVWDVASARHMAVLSRHSGPVLCVAVSPDGRTAASGGRDETVRLCDTATGQELRTLKGHTFQILCLAFSPDGSIVASGSHDRTIKLWDVSTGAELRTLEGHDGWVNAVAFSPDGRTLASGGRDASVKLWDPSTREELQVLAGHTGCVRCVALSPDAALLASTGEDGTVRVWDVAAGRELLVVPASERELFSVAFSSDGRMLSTGGWDKKVRIWDAASGRELHSLIGHEGLIYCTKFSPHGDLLASASYDKTVKLWDPVQGKELRTLTGHAGRIRPVAFSPDGRLLATASYDFTLKLWDIATGADMRTFTGHTDAALTVAFSPDGRLLASGSSDETVRLWDVATGTELRRLAGHSDWVFSVVFSPDGRFLASGGFDNVIKFWDSTAGREIATLEPEAGHVDYVTFSRDGRLLAVAVGKEAHIYDLHAYDARITNWVNEARKEAVLSER